MTFGVDHPPAGKLALDPHRHLHPTIAAMPHSADRPARDIAADRRPCPDLSGARASAGA
jgi:hypothetical protein